MRYLEYFEALAPRRQRIRRRHSYYWDGITRLCNFFSNEEARVLEVGCGTGELIGQIKGDRKVGIDFSPAMVEIAQKTFPGVHFEVMKAEKITFNEKFDLIILSNLIGYLEDVETVFRQIKPLTHSRTKIIITYYNFVWEPLLKFGEWIGLKTKTPNQNWLSAADIRNLLFLGGFEEYRSASLVLLPAYIPFISSFVNKFLSKLPILRQLALNLYSFSIPRQEPDPKSIERKYSVSIVIPARNESGNIKNALQRLPDFGKCQEIIFVEGGSDDDTWAKIEETKASVSSARSIVTVRQEGKGKADAVRKGFGLATGDILMILDADLTVPPEDLPKFYNALAMGKGDFINGNRLVYPMEKQAMRFLNLLGNKFFGAIFSFLLEQRIKDTLCGTKALFRDDYLRIVRNRAFFGDFDPFGDFDLLFGAYKLNLRLVEVPIRYRERTFGRTNISRFRHGWLLLRMCLFAFRRITLYLM